MHVSCPVVSRRGTPSKLKEKEEEGCQQRMGQQRSGRTSERGTKEENRGGDDGCRDRDQHDLKEKEKEKKKEREREKQREKENGGGREREVAEMRGLRTK